MTEPPTAPTPRPRRRRPWLLAWLAITLACSLLHMHVWNPPLDAGSAAPFTAERLLKVANNVLQLAILPAWAVMWRILGRFQDLQTTLLANALGWAWWTLVAYRTFAPHPARAPATDVRTDHARRRFLLSVTRGTLAAGAASAGAAASIVLPWNIQTTRYRVRIRDLPATLDGFRIVQISDTHLGPRIPRSHIARALALAAGLKPDLIALTGDYIHMGSWYITPAVELFSTLVDSKAARLGVLAVLGNHDHYGDAPRTIAELRRAGINVLDNDRVFLTASGQLQSKPSAVDPQLCISGVGDLLEGTVDLRAALRDVPEGTPTIMLAHNPDTLELRAQSGMAVPRVDLQLSGHTHGGQVRLPGIGAPIVPSRFGQRFAYGLVKTACGEMVVSSGVGMSIMPVRFGVPPEIVEVTLVRA